MNKIKSGFTLIEILIVIAIIGVLSVSLVPNIAGAPARARDLAKKQAITQADAAMKAYIVLNGSAVNVVAETGDIAAANDCLKTEDGNVAANDANYITKIKDKWLNRVFDGELPSADTLETATINNDNCITNEGKVYPKFVMTDNGKYKFSIKVEAGSSANNDAGTHFEMGSLVE